MLYHSSSEVTSQVTAPTPTKSAIAETMAGVFRHVPASFTPYCPPQVSYLWKGVIFRQKPHTVTNYDPNPLGGDEGSRGDVPCVRRIARKKAPSRTVTYTRVYYIETI